MIVQCADCKTSFRLQANLVPPQQIQVRCSRCGSVFAIDGRNASTPPPAQAPAPAAAPDPGKFNDIALDASAAPPTPRPVEAAPAPPAPAPAPLEPTPVAQAPAMEFEIERSNTPVHPGGQPATATTMEAPPETSSESFRELDLDGKPAAAPAEAAPVDPETQKQNDKARRLARALVSDILVYNREKRDSSLKGGNLVQVLGPEIKKSWEVYKERVTPDLANNSDHFREALNEILAEGQPIF